MIYSDTYKYIFFHVPKSGGTSINNALKMCPKDTYIQIKRSHVTPKACIKILGREKFQNYFKFGFIRNPWERILSHYMYSKERNKKQYQPGGNREHIKNLNDYITYSRTTEDPMIWLSIDNEIVMDFIGRFENLTQDFMEVKKRLYLPSYIKLNHYKKSHHKHYSYYYNKNSQEIIRKKSQRLLNYFEYTFEDKRRKT